MKNSIWEVKGQSFSYPTLVNDIETDVAIIGGGITGISCAQSKLFERYRACSFLGFFK